MTVPRVDDKDYALAMDGYGINTGKWTHKSDSRCYRVSWEQKLPRHVLDHGDTVDLAYGTGSYDCVIAIIKPNVDGQIGNSLFGRTFQTPSQCCGQILGGHSVIFQSVQTPRQEGKGTRKASNARVGTDSEAQF